MTGSRPARAALLVLTMAAAGAGRARAQGVVFSPEGKPLPVRVKTTFLLEPSECRLKERSTG